MKQREIKFRYRIRLETNRIEMVNLTLANIESGYLRGYINSACEILSKDEFTGLKDKNGKEIYEGDILKRGKDKLINQNGNEWIFVAVIEFANGQFGGATYPNRNHWIEISNLNSCDSDGGGYDEVIGNIYENKDLLK